jgi:N-glycosylase/DNA lyase
MPDGDHGSGGAPNSRGYSHMNEFPLITEAALARARQDADFRQQLLTESLDLLLGELSKLQRATQNAARADQVREGVELAVKLADLLRRTASGAPSAA